mgnify:CR=1 FL=1
MDNVIICAAGTGSRIGLNKPKCLIEICGKPIIYWQLDVLEDYKNIVIVVGFKGDEVIKTVLKRRKDVIFVENRDYATTNTLDSLRLGAKEVVGPFISLDGDLLVLPQSLELLEKAPLPCLGIKLTYSENPVCVRLVEENNKLLAVEFTREILEYEWTGLTKISQEHLFKADKNNYIYQALEHFLPLECVIIDCYEIDTLEDLHGAELWMKKQILSGNFGRNAMKL